MTISEIMTALNGSFYVTWPQDKNEQSRNKSSKDTSEGQGKLLLNASYQNC